MLDLILSTLVFFVASYFLKRYLDNQGIPPGMTRALLVLVLATVASFAVSAVISQFDHEPSVDQQVMHTLGQMSMQ